MTDKRAPVFNRTTVNIKDRRAALAANWDDFGPGIGSEIQVSIADAETGNGVTIAMSWEQARELRHRLSTAIEAALLGSGEAVAGAVVEQVNGGPEIHEFTAPGFSGYRITSADGLHTLHSSAPTREAALEEFQDWANEGFAMEDVSLDEAVQRG